jgi:hypothetical protein
MIDLDDAITRAAPRATRSHELDSAVADLVRRSRPVPRGRRWAMRIGIGAVAAGVLAGGAAAATTAIDWVPWLAEPDYAFEFTTPGGLDCEGRAAVDDPYASPAELDALRDIIRDEEIFARAVDRVPYFLLDDQPDVDPDQAYVYGLADSYSFQVGTELTARGAEQIGWGLQIQCPGATW